MFKIGTYVSYRAEGVCIISDIQQESFGALGSSEEYYILTPISDSNSKLYVPVSNEVLVAKMLPLLSEEEIAQLAESVKDERIEWREESRARSYIFKELLATGDRRLLIILVNTLDERNELAAKGGKKLTAGDENTLKRAKRMLIDEFSITSSISNEQALMELLKGKSLCVAE